MKLSVSKIKVLSFIAMLALVYAGRWHNPSDGIYFGMTAGAVSVFVVDLVLARGMLQNKIRSLKVVFFLFILGILPFQAIKLAVGIVVIAALLITDSKQVDTAVHGDVSDLPLKYLKKRPVKTLFELMLRLFPNPEPTGLYRIGEADASSPVFVTGNFELTVRRVAKALAGTDCWLLVCDSRGINIWCSTEAGHFGTKHIVDAIVRTDLASRVDHRRIILPQLSASNVSVGRIEDETGFRSVFGPVHIRNIAAYMENPKDMGIRKVTFNLNERIEAGIGSPTLLAVLLLIVFNFIGLHHLAVILPAVYFYTVIQAMIFPKRIIRNVWLWALFFGGFTFALNYLFLYNVLKVGFWIDSLAISIGVAYLVLEFQGWSPLVKFNYIGYRKVGISVDEELCIGCGACMTVCPKAVFKVEGGKSRVVDRAACVSCRACMVQCPVNAIDVSLNF